MHSLQWMKPVIWLVGGMRLASSAARRLFMRDFMGCSTRCRGGHCPRSAPPCRGPPRMARAIGGSWLALLKEAVQTGKQYSPLAVPFLVGVSIRLVRLGFAML